MMATKRLNYRKILILMTLALVISSIGFPTVARAFSVTITVNTNADNTTLDGLCSLREAITNANDNAQTDKDCSTGFGHETINFDGAMGTATITLGSALPPIADAGLTIIGGGRITISGNDLYRVFYTNNGVPLTLDGLTVTRGRSFSGGGAYINPNSTFTVLNSTFSNNNALNLGGGVGGGIDSYGTVAITNSIFSGNTADATGGGVVTAGTLLTITNSTFSGNSAGYGGGIRNYSGSIIISKSTFSSNHADSFGGGIYNQTGTLTITGSTFSSNTAGVDASSGLGGGIANTSNLTLANSTFFSNSAGVGGGVYTSSNATLTNNTFSGNSASISGGGVSNGGGTFILSNNIIANSPTGGDCDDPGIHNVLSINNLIEDAVNSCDLLNGDSGNIIGSDPNLGIGAGSPAYITLNSGSLAIDAGSDANCASPAVANTSQNGQTRPQGAHCDIGSYEVDKTPPTVSFIARANPNPTISASVIFTVTFSEPVYGVTVNDFALTTTGVTGAAVSGVSAVTGSIYNVTVATGSGSGTIRLNLVDRDTILDTANLYLGGTGLGNGNFTTGEVYDVRPAATATATITPTPTATATSTPTQPTPTQTATITPTPDTGSITVGHSNHLYLSMIQLH